MAGISFLQLLKNSWAIDLLLIFSVIALAVILERLWSYSKLGIDEKALLDRVKSAFKRGNIQEASFICKSVNHPLGEVLDVGIKNRDYQGKILPIYSMVLSLKQKATWREKTRS